MTSNYQVSERLSEANSKIFIWKKIMLVFLQIGLLEVIRLSVRILLNYNVNLLFTA